MLPDPGGYDVGPHHDRPRAVGASTRPTANVDVEPGGLNLNSKCHRRSCGGCAGGQEQECSLPRLEAVDDPVDVSEETVFLTKAIQRRYRAIRGRFRSFIKKFVNIKKLSGARDPKT